MSNGVEVIFQDLARDLEELGEAAQEVEALLNRGAGAREATGRQLANAFGLGGTIAQHMKQAWETKSLIGLQKPTSMSVQITGVVITWNLD